LQLQPIGSLEKNLRLKDWTRTEKTKQNTKIGEPRLAQFNLSPTYGGGPFP
jgi:hypothetical protein